jgi:hypothetical protein
MFEKLKKKLAKKVVKEFVGTLSEPPKTEEKKETPAPVIDVENNLPVILGFVTVGLLIISAIPVRPKLPTSSSVTIINNYYIGGHLK